MLLTDQKGNIAEQGEVFGSPTQIRLLLGPCKNNRQQRINWANEFEFAAKLGRPTGP
jgi:hypothetical protein